MAGKWQHHSHYTHIFYSPWRQPISTNETDEVAGHWQTEGFFFPPLWCGDPTSEALQDKLETDSAWPFFLQCFELGIFKKQPNRSLFQDTFSHLSAQMINYRRFKLLRNKGLDWNEAITTDSIQLENKCQIIVSTIFMLTSSYIKLWIILWDMCLRPICHINNLLL